MRKLILLGVLVIGSLAASGCGPKDAHEIHLERNRRITHAADYRSMLDDIQMNITMDNRPSHLSNFPQE